MRSSTVARETIWRFVKTFYDCIIILIIDQTDERKTKLFLYYITDTRVVVISVAKISYFDANAKT